MQAPETEDEMQLPKVHGDKKRVFGVQDSKMGESEIMSTEKIVKEVLDAFKGSTLNQIHLKEMLELAIQKAQEKYEAEIQDITTYFNKSHEKELKEAIQKTREDVFNQIDSFVPSILCVNDPNQFVKELSEHIQKLKSENYAP